MVPFCGPNSSKGARKSLERAHPTGAETVAATATELSGQAAETQGDISVSAADFSVGISLTSSFDEPVQAFHRSRLTGHAPTRYDLLV
jgi:hypothetical protein